MLTEGSARREIRREHFEEFFNRSMSDNQVIDVELNSVVNEINTDSVSG